MKDKELNRREFLIAAGCCGTVLLFGAGCSKAQGTEAAETVCPYGYRYDPWPGQCVKYVDQNGSGYCDLSEAGLVTDSSMNTQAATGLVLCDRGCSYPGECGRYVDNDNTGICDLSEGIPSEQVEQAQATQTPEVQSEDPGSDLVVLCDRGCSYPGECGRYVDNDNTGICDLSEGIPGDQVATFDTHGQGGRVRVRNRGN